MVRGRLPAPIGRVGPGGDLLVRQREAMYAALFGGTEARQVHQATPQPCAIHMLRDRTAI